MADFDRLVMHMPNSKNKRKVKRGELCGSFLSIEIWKNSCKLLSMTVLSSGAKCELHTLLDRIGHYSSDSARWDLTDTPLPHKAKETTQHQLELMERIIFNELPRAQGCESGKKDLGG